MLKIPSTPPRNLRKATDAGPGSTRLPCRVNGKAADVIDVTADRARLARKSAARRNGKTDIGKAAKDTAAASETAVYRDPPEGHIQDWHRMAQSCSHKDAPHLRLAMAAASLRAESEGDGTGLLAIANRLRRQRAQSSASDGSGASSDGTA